MQKNGSNEKSFIVMNGDVITNIDLKKLMKKENSIASIELMTKFGVMELEGGKIIRFSEKKPISNTWMNAGIYFLEKNIFPKLPQKGDIEKTLFPKMAKEGNLNVTKFPNSKWYSIDSFKDLEECSEVISKII